MNSRAYILFDSEQPEKVRFAGWSCLPGILEAGKNFIQR